MSSAAFWSYLKPDPLLRIVVVICGHFTAGITTVVVLTMGLPLAVRASVCVACIAYAAYELRQIERGFDDCREIKVAVGAEIWLRDGDNRWVAASLVSGSILLRHCGWLRLQSVDGRSFSELLRAGSQSAADWRRLHVIWRHIGAV